MRIELFLPRRRRRLALVVLAVACLPLLERRVPAGPGRDRIVGNSRLVTHFRKSCSSSLTVPADEEKPASLFIQDIYQGMTGIERGRVKYVRVMGVLPWLWDQEGMFRIGLNVDVHRKKVYGIAKVHEDGSAYFTVPAEENLFFQAIDENFMALQHMPTFINLMPGETSPRMVDYAADVQRVLDKHCVGCHGGESAKGRLDLTGVPTESFSRAYENLIGKGLVSYRDCRYGRSGFRPEPPLSFGAHLSKLVERIRQDPCKANLTREELIKIVTWIDANVPYYGTYRGKRSLQDKDHPNFRALPLAGK